MSRDFAQPVVVVTGFMGTGKTSVGRALADMLGVGFIDTDEAITRAEGMPVAEIFSRKGEAHFRDLERKFVRSLEGVSGAVIATGGGTIVDDANRKLLARLGPTVLLETATEVLAQRLGDDTSRPLLGNDARSLEGRIARIETLLRERAAAYRDVRLRIDTTHLAPIEAATRIGARLDLTNESIDVNLVPPSDPPLPGGRFGPARIVIGRGALCQLGGRLKDMGLDASVFLLMPLKLQELYLAQVKASLDDAGVSFTVVTVKDGDVEKHLTQVTRVIDELIDAGARRDATIVPIGGGVTGDIGGFVASCFMRGVSYVQVPTTLLAQVDSSVGAKVGVNHPLAKNLIGAFYQPHLILDDPCTFRTLPLDEIANGMAEVVKSSLIGSPALFETIERQLSKDSAQTLRDISFLETCVREAAAIKADIVNRDPFEGNVRRFMNLGHTLGHAIEASGRYTGFKHGQAVALGMVAALRIAVARRRIGRDLFDRVFAVLEWCRLPVRFDEFDRESLARAIRLDKKIRRGRLHFVLPTGLGSAEVVDDVSVEEILSAIEKGAP